MRGNAGQCSGKRELEGAILRPEGTTFRGRQGKKPKNLAGARQNDPPTPRKKSRFRNRAVFTKPLYNPNTPGI